MAGNIAGTVVDMRNYQPIDGVTVEAQPGAHTTATDDNGTYSLSLDGGTYNMTVTKTGYEPWVAEGIFVMEDATTEINITMHPID